MKQKIALFDRRRETATASASTRIPWRTRRREEPRQTSASQSEFNSIRVNTADYRSLDLLRQYDDERNNVSSGSQRTSEHDQKQPTSSMNEFERYQSEGRNQRVGQSASRRPGECLFLTSGYKVNARNSPTFREILSSTKDVDDGYDAGSLPFPERSREGVLLRAKGCLLIAFISLSLTAIMVLSCYYSCRHSSKKGSVHALVSASPIARLLGLSNIVDMNSDARNMWINHVVKNDDNQILIAETFESRLNAEIAPLLEKYVDKIWDDASSPSLTCHGSDQLMTAFSMTKAGSMPASITYETPCMNGPLSRNCVVKKQISDVRDLVVRLPSKSSRYMHSVRLEVNHARTKEQNNSSEVRHIQDLGTASGQFRVELSDASRLALQRYCGQNRKVYSDDLMTEPLSASNTRLINVYELKRLYGLLARQSYTLGSSSTVWDTRMLSTVVIDPLEHSRHSLTPIHIQQLVSQLRTLTDSQTSHRTRDSRFPRIAASAPSERTSPVQSTLPNPHEGKSDDGAVASGPSPSSQAWTLPSPSSAQSDTSLEMPSFNFQPPASIVSDREGLGLTETSSVVSKETSTGASPQKTSADPEQQTQYDPNQQEAAPRNERDKPNMGEMKVESRLVDEQTVDGTSNETLDASRFPDKGESTLDQQSPDTHIENSTGATMTSGGNPVADDLAEKISQNVPGTITPPQNHVPGFSSEFLNNGYNRKNAVPSVKSKGSKARRKRRRRSSKRIRRSMAPASEEPSLLSPLMPERLSHISVPSSSTTTFEQQPPLTAQSSDSTGLQLARLNERSKETENRRAPSTGTRKQQAAADFHQLRQTSKRGLRNTAYGSVTSQSATQLPSQDVLTLSGARLYPTQKRIPESQGSLLHFREPHRQLRNVWQ